MIPETRNYKGLDNVCVQEVIDETTINNNQKAISSARRRAECVEVITCYKQKTAITDIFY